MIFNTSDLPNRKYTQKNTDILITVNSLRFVFYNKHTTIFVPNNYMTNNRIIPKKQKATSETNAIKIDVMTYIGAR